MGDVSWSAGVAPRENYPGYPPSNVTGYPGAAAPSYPQFSNQMPSAPVHEISYGYAGVGSHNLAPLGAEAFGSAPPQSYSAGPPVYNQPQQMSLLDGLNVPSGNAYSTPPYAPATPHPSAPSSYPDMGSTYPSLQSQPPPPPTAPSSYPTAPSSYPTAPSSYSEGGATYAPLQSSYSEGGATYASLQSQQPPPPSSYPTAPSSYPTAPSSYPEAGASYPALQSQQPPQFGYSDVPHLQHQQNTGNSYPDFVTGPVPHMLGYPTSQSEAVHSHPSFNRPAVYGRAADSYESPGVSAFPSTVSYESQHSGYDMEEGGEVYAYDGGKEEPYGARGTYGGSQWGDNPGKASGTGGSGAGKSSDACEEDGLQKFHVKLLPDEGMSSAEKRNMSVVCQIGLDGVKLLDPESSRTLRIYPLETITRWAPAVKDSAVFTFWAKSAVDVEQRPVKLQSTQRTTTEILDTLTAACVQLVEMRPHTGGGDGKDKTGGDKDTGKAKAASTMSFVPWMTTLSKPAVVEEKEHWVPDENANKCKGCSADFTAFNRRHHCRNCGDIFCDKCTRGRIALTQEEGAVPVRVCDHCLAEVTQRITNAQPATSTPPSTLRSHSDLAKTLHDEMERNARRASATAAAAASANKLSAEAGGRSAGGEPASVVSCSKCGSVSFVTGGDTKCASCGTDTSRPSQPSPVTTNMATWFNHGSGQQSAIQQPSQGQQQAWVPQGPPHLWPSNQGQTPPESSLMREVACPTCTVHLQVKVPASGTETVECGVCEHPFLVPAN